MKNYAYWVLTTAPLSSVWVVKIARDMVGQEWIFSLAPLQRYLSSYKHHWDDDPSFDENRIDEFIRSTLFIIFGSKSTGYLGRFLKKCTQITSLIYVLHIEEYRIEELWEIMSLCRVLVITLHFFSLQDPQHCRLPFLHFHPLFWDFPHFTCWHPKLIFFWIGSCPFVTYTTK